MTAARPGARSLGLGALIALVSLTCVALGYWQWTRHEARASAVAVVERNYDAEPVPLAEVIPPGGLAGADDTLDADLAWLPVTVRGEFLEPEVLLRNRPVDGVAAMHSLALLRTDEPSPRLLLIDRGWVPAGDPDAPEALAARALPEGTVDLVVRLRPAEPDAERAAPQGQVYTVTPALVAELAGSTGDEGLVVGAYGTFVAQDPPPEQPLGTLAAASTDLGSHLSYAFQWWVFALGAPVAAVVLAHRNRVQPPEASGAARPAPRRRPTLEEEEDAALDAAERAAR